MGGDDKKNRQAQIRFWWRFHSAFDEGSVPVLLCFAVLCLDILTSSAAWGTMLSRPLCSLPAPILAFFWSHPLVLISDSTQGSLLMRLRNDVVLRIGLGLALCQGEHLTLCTLSDPYFRICIRGWATPIMGVFVLFCFCFSDHTW